MPKSQRFPYVEGTSPGTESTLPFLPLKLSHRGTTLSALGLLDSGSTVNVLPHSLGLQLGVSWEDQKVAIQLTGNLAKLPARALVLTAQVGTFDPVRLGFAWTKSDEVPLILGQMNFFLEFNICFYRAEHSFEITPIQLYQK